MLQKVVRQEWIKPYSSMTFINPLTYTWKVHLKPIADISQLHLVDESWHVSLDEFETWKSNLHFKI